MLESARLECPALIPGPDHDDSGGTNRRASEHLTHRLEARQLAAEVFFTENQQLEILAVVEGMLER